MLDDNDMTIMYFFLLMVVAALAVAGGVLLVGALGLAVARYDAAVAAGFALLGVVLIEPAPADGVFVVALPLVALGVNPVIGRGSVLGHAEGAGSCTASCLT